MSNRTDTVYAGLVSRSWFATTVQAGLNKGEARNALARAVFSTGWVKSGTGGWRIRVTGPVSDVTDSGNRVMEHGIHRKSHESLKRKKLPINDQLLSHLSRWAGSISILMGIMSGVIILSGYREVPTITQCRYRIVQKTV